MFWCGGWGGWRVKSGRLTGIGFAVFVFFSLAIFPVLVVRNLVKGVRWPFYVLSGSMLL